MNKYDIAAPAPPVTASELSGQPELRVSSLPVKLDVPASTPKEIDLEGILDSWRASNYLAVAQIFLQGNALLREKLTPDHVKSRLLGHYGTTAGLTMVYSHFSALLRRHESDPVKGLIVIGPGHGAPAVLGELFVEGSLSHFAPKYPQTEEGLNAFVKSFSWPGGFPSHVNAETPGAIHEGGELGYALAVAYGSVMDNPDLITTVIVGDGESETGPTAGAWHSHKWIDPKESGAVLPVLHVNGFKISERTLPGTMDTTELALLYTGSGYQVRFVDYQAPKDGKNATMGGYDKEDEDVHRDMAVSIEWAYDEIRKIQQAARSGKPIDKPRWPMIIMRTPKGWTGPAAEHGKQLLNSHASHQVPLPDAKSDKGALEYLEAWLKSYRPEQLFDLQNKSNVIPSKLLTAFPTSEQKRLGFAKDSYAAYQKLELPDWKTIGFKQGEEQSAMKATGAYLREVIKTNPHTFRIFSPDELASNKLDAVFEVTHRNFQWDPETAHDGGRVLEMLSEHTLQGWLQGYTLTGRYGVFPSYESFLGIVTTMVVQYSKFIKVALETPWRQPVPSLTYIETSTWTRQEHNGFSHQNPGFISTVLSLPVHLARVYFPADANTAISCMEHCLNTQNLVQVIVGTKAPSKVFLSVEEADEHCTAGASIWEKYSTDDGVDPDIVLVGIGFELTVEVLACAKLLQEEFGDNLRVRVVNVVDLMILAADHPHALSPASFNSLFPPETPIVMNFHGYPAQLASLLFHRTHSVGRSRFHISGYSEQGTTTTPFMMLKVNKCDRFFLAQKALDMVNHNFAVTGNIRNRDKRERIARVVARTVTFTAKLHRESERLEAYTVETQQDHPSVGHSEVLKEG